MIESDKVYYRRWDIELRYSWDQAQPVPLREAKKVVLDEEPTVEQARRLFTVLGLALPRAFGDREVSDIIRKAIEPTNLYEDA